MYNGREMMDRRKTPLEIHVTESHQCSVEVRLDILGCVPFFAGLSHDRLEQINGLSQFAMRRMSLSIYPAIPASVSSSSRTAGSD
jgi:hypothetical protein